MITLETAMEDQECQAYWKAPVYTSSASGGCLQCAVHIHLNSGLHFMIYSWYSCPSDRPIFSFIPTCDAPMKASRKGLGTKPNHLLTVLCCGQHPLPSQNNSVFIHSFIQKKKKRTENAWTLETLRIEDKVERLGLARKKGNLWQSALEIS